MAKWGSCDFTELKRFQKELEKLENERNAFIEACTKELAARLLAKVIKRTPVGEYPSSSGKVGGTLRRGWTSEKNQNVKNYVENLNIKHVGNIYQIEITNPVEYASYVEFGHRTRNGKGWVEGHFMMTISEQEIQASAPKLLETKIKKLLSEVF